MVVLSGHEEPALLARLFVGIVVLARARSEVMNWLTK